MSDATFNNSTPQFGTAEYSGAPGSAQCQFCQQAIGGNYYRVNETMACPSCASTMQVERANDSHAAFVRGIAAGIAAALAGLIAYATLTILLQGWIISYMSFGVGWLVGVAMMKASHGVGGRRYQIAAVVLTYAAISLSAIPVSFYFASKKSPQQTEREKLQAEQRQLEDESGQAHQEPTPEPKRTIDPFTVLGRIAMLGLASPFLELQSNPFYGAMGLLILFVGLKIAWKITAGKPLQIYGPFHDRPQPAR